MNKAPTPKRPKPRQRVSQLSAVLARLYYEARRDYSIDLSHRAIRVLQLTAYRADPPRIDDVATQLDCAISTASELVKRLQSKGLLERRRSKFDERVVELYLTDKGDAVLQEHTTLDSAKLALGLSALPARKQDELIRLARELAQEISGRIVS